jgi:hypothetical protein
VKRLGCALAVIAVWALVLPVSASHAPTTGYWSRLAAPVALPVPVEPPTPVPDGGSWVAGDPSGPIAVTAIRAVADAGSVISGFRFTIADQVGSPTVLACPTTETWAAQRAGRIEAAPRADCSSPITATVVDGALVVDLPPAQRRDTVDLLLSPGPDTAFSLTLEPVTARSMSQVPVLRPVAMPEVSFPDEPAFDPGIPDVPGVVAPPVDLAPVSPGTTPTLAPPVVAPTPPAVAAPAQSPAAIEDRTVPLLALAVLVVLGVMALRLGAEPTRPPRLLGGASRLREDPVPIAVRGVGRFQGPRTEPPVRL